MLICFLGAKFHLDIQSHSPLCSFCKIRLIPDFVSSFGNIKASFILRSFIAKFSSIKTQKSLSSNFFSGDHKGKSKMPKGDSPQKRLKLFS